jgi:hypothetical protein
VTTLSDYLNAHLPHGWQKPQLVDALSGVLDRATVYKYLAGSHPLNPQDSVLTAFASVLPGVTVVQLRLAANQPPGAEEPWTPPVEANRLTYAQRRALEVLIKTMVSSKEVAEPLPVSAVVEAAEPTLDPSEQEEVQAYLAQLHASGRSDLADRVAASLVINSASETASRSSNN